MNTKQISSATIAAEAGISFTAAIDMLTKLGRFGHKHETQEQTMKGTGLSPRRTPFLGGTAASSHTINLQSERGLLG